MNLFSEAEINEKTGNIEVICGSMFSGKTEELMRRIKRAEFARQSVIIFKPSVDKRYSETKVVSHDMKAVPCISLTKAEHILEESAAVDVVCIDEAQFFDSELIDICQKLANRGKRVIVAGLDMDFKGEPFGSIPGLLAVADHVTKLHAICVKCGALAQFSHRLTLSKQRIMLGEKELYEPLCRKCFGKALKDSESQKSLTFNE
ncbi:thymidine kinase [Saccharicrinis sp. FJH54]|uniref:thymidine kinase n=1 Tax=Saccharicrinis sp. FJH54 TaxID=3344665 RepID=UPI0035D43949